EGHEGVSGTLLKMRKRAWVVQGRRLAQKVVNQCIQCRRARAQVCQQVMGDLPPTPSEELNTQHLGQHSLKSVQGKCVCVCVCAR
ncbi:uncharacterized protein V6R79_018242, partial [Siganus canaliculatus]